MLCYAKSSDLIIVDYANAFKNMLDRVNEEACFN